MFLISFVQKSSPLQEVGIHHFLKCNFLKGKNWRRRKKYLWLKDRKKNATKKSQKKEANGNMLGKWVNLTVPSILQPRYNPKDHHVGDIRISSPVVWHLCLNSWCTAEQKQKYFNPQTRAYQKRHGIGQLVPAHVPTNECLQKQQPTFFKFFANTSSCCSK